MDFRNAKELLKVCQEQGLSISAVMLQRELTEGEQDPEETDRKMDRVLEIMKSAASTPIQDRKSTRLNSSHNRESRMPSSA